MIVRELRKKRDWSQEQLAEFSGLNVRTIQRVESGQKASLETLKCLASVFEVELSRLTEVITVIDKTSTEWKKLPWWFKANMVGVNSRRQVLMVEGGLLLGGFASWILAPDLFATPMIFLAAYATALIVRFGDQHNAW